MKYIFRILLISLAFIIAFPIVAIASLWNFRFDTVKGMWRDQKELVSIDLYKAFRIKTKHLPTYYYDKRHIL
jgi:hypothetical protein